VIILTRSPDNTTSHQTFKSDCVGVVAITKTSAPFGFWVTCAETTYVHNPEITVVHSHSQLTVTVSLQLAVSSDLVPVTVNAINRTNRRESDKWHCSNGKNQSHALLVAAIYVYKVDDKDQPRT
jgi:hypothetical protein